MILNSNNINIIKRLLVGRNSRPLQAILLKVEIQSLVQIFSLLNDHETRHLIDALVSVHKAGEVLTKLPNSQLEELFLSLDKNRIFSIVANCSDNDAAELMISMNEEMRSFILDSLTGTKKIRIQKLLSYPEDSAGRLMTTDVFTLPTDMSAEAAIEKIRNRSQDISVYYIYCVDEKNKLTGVLSLRELVSSSAGTPLQKIIKKEIISIHTNAPSKEAAQLVSQYDFVAVPVVDDDGVLKGIITVDDVLDVIQEQATAEIYASAGLQEGDRVYSPIRYSVKTRLPWMALNLLTATIASFVVSRFENTMSQLIVLASLNNIVAGIGGNTAIQTLTVVTRGIATGDFNFITHYKAILKEFLTGLSVGTTIGLLAGVLVYFWKENFSVAVIICIAMILNSMLASFVGALVPITLKKLKYDPASGSGVLVTFVTDSFGFFSFLGIATLGLKWYGNLL